MLSTGFIFFPHGHANNSLCGFVIAEHPQKKLGHRPQKNGNKTFVRISLLHFNSIYAGISKKKGPQFSRLYLRNCPEKMGENRFCAPCCLFLSFWAYKNLQGIPPCQLKYSKGGFQSPRLKAEHMSQEKTCTTLGLQL